MKVSIITGSVREGRQSHRAAVFVADSLKKRGVETHLIDLAKEPLPVFGFAPDQEPEAEERIESISERLDESHAIILVTPEYHGSFSGAIKNALDHFTPEFRKKPVGVVAASAGKMAGINASSQLQHVILGMGAYPLPLKLLIPEIHNAFDDSFKPQNGMIVKSAGKFLDELLWFTDALNQKKQIESEQAA